MIDRSPKKISIWPFGLLAVMLGAWLIGNLLWLRSNDHPFGPFILTESYRFASALADRGWSGWTTLWNERNAQPPLFPALLGAFHHWFGVHRLNAALITALFILAGLPALYLVALRLTERWWLGLVACALFLLAPQIAFYSRAPLPAVSAAALVPLVLWGLLASDDGRQAFPLLLAGLAFAVGMLLHWMFLPAVAGAFLIFAAQALIRRRRIALPMRRQVQRRRMRNLLFACALVFFLAGPWYLRSFAPDRIAAAARDVATGSPLAAALWYFVFLHRTCLSPGLTHALVLLCPFFFVGEKGSPWWFLLGTLFLFYLFLCFLPDQNAVYAPLLIPLIALLVPYLLRRFFDWLPPDLRFLSPLLALLLVLVGFFYLIDISFRRSLYPDGAGALVEQPAACLADFDTVFSRLEALLPAEAETVTVAFHPLTVNSLSFSDDALAHALSLHNLREKPLLRGAGFNLESYVVFPERLSSVDFLLVQSDIWDLTESQLQEKLSALSSLPPPSVSVDLSADPLYRLLILSHFKLVDKIVLSCSAPIEVYHQ